MAENPKNRAKSVEELIKAMKWLQEKNKENNLMETVFKGYSTSEFKGTDKEMTFLVEVLEEAQGMKEQIEKEQMMHLETINQFSTCPSLHEVLHERARLNALTHDTNFNQLKKENRDLQSDLANVVRESHHQIRDLNEKINKMEAEHQDLLSIYQMQLDETYAQIKTLEGRQNFGGDCVQHSQRLDELWRENQAIADQLDSFRKMYLSEKAKNKKNASAKPKIENKSQEIEGLNKQIDNFVCQLVDKDEALGEAEKARNQLKKELETAKKRIQELELGKDGWKVVDAEDSDVEVWADASA